MARTKLIISIIATLVLSSCTFGFNPEGYKHETMPLDEAWKYVASFDYQDDPYGYWKSPHEFVHDGGGDCEDFASTLIYYLGEGEVYIIKYSDTLYHAIVYYKGRFLEPQIYDAYFNEKYITIVEKYSFDEVMMQCTALGTKGV